MMKIGAAGSSKPAGAQILGHEEVEIEDSRSPEGGTQDGDDAEEAGDDDSEPLPLAKTRGCNKPTIACFSCTSSFVITTLGMLAAWSFLNPPYDPAEHSEKLPVVGEKLSRLLFGSCSDQRYTLGHFDAAADRQPDLFVLMGDNVYGDCYEPTCENLATAYKNLSMRPSFSGFRRRFPMVAVWDDHDFGLNDGGATFAWKETAKHMFLKFFALPITDERRGEGRGLFTSWIFGHGDRKLQLILLDTRWYRSDLLKADPPGPGRERYVPDESASKTMLGDQQWLWLESELKKPVAVRILVSSIQVIALNHGYEKWGNFPKERDRLLRLLRSASPVPLVFSGDRHVGGLYKENSASPAVFELTSSALTHTMASAPSGREHHEELRLGSLVHQNNMAMLDIDWENRYYSVGLIRADGRENFHSLAGQRTGQWLDKVAF
eukprot:TRINITY_DN754_c0_g2_i1.p1 TRINITY_DN754_c0_g2~~TRINITY_DN754_c0_g2_i1.p1  ORF type:complete len:435 (+),score=75.84 TRINITY_DN754_c0_g2_i1:101-1405(+)